MDRPVPARHRIHAAGERVPGVLRLRSRPAAVPDLTINQRPQGADLDDDPYGAFIDGPIRYGSVKTFDPAPYADSGKQFPFGLDGIGGFGSDVGFLAGQDAASYDRGP